MCNKVSSVETASSWHGSRHTIASSNSNKWDSIKEVLFGNNSFFSLLYRMWNWTEINSVGSQLRRYVALSLCKIYNFKTILLVSPIINVWIVMWKILTLWARKFKNEFFLVNWFGTWENFFFQSKRKFRLGAKRLVFSFSHQFLMMDEFNDKFQTSLFDFVLFFVPIGFR